MPIPEVHAVWKLWQYMTRWRMSLAHERLATTKESVMHVAELSGYQSEAAFAKAFKKHFGFGPGTVKKKKENN